MRLPLLALATVAAVSATSAAHADVVIRTNGKTRQVDCHGSTLTVDGNANRLKVVRCPKVMVDGNGNGLTVTFSEPGRLALLGNRNRVAYRAARGVPVRVSDVGTGNRVTRE
jgi:hypothetical protein